MPWKIAFQKAAPLEYSHVSEIVITKSYKNYYTNLNLRYFFDSPISIIKAYKCLIWLNKGFSGRGAEGLEFSARGFGVEPDVFQAIFFSVFMCFLVYSIQILLLMFVNH